MNITITKSIINNTEINSINARDLHEFLNVGRDFSTWIKQRIEKYEFQENEDYILTNHKTGERQNVIVIDYIISIDMAKELSMVENNEKGKQARKYFIECERKLKEENQFKQPKTFSEACLLNYHQALMIEEQQKLIEQQKPAVEFLDRYVETKASKGIREVAKILSVKEKDFVQQLLDRSIMFRQSGFLLPYAEYQHKGYFEVKTGESHGHAYHQTRFTPSGIAWIVKKFEL